VGFYPVALRAVNIMISVCGLPDSVCIANAADASSRSMAVGVPDEQYFVLGMVLSDEE